MKVNRLKVNSEKELRDKLDLIFQNARERKHFYGVLELIRNEQVVLTALHNIKSNRGSKTAGVDGETIDNLLQMPKDECIKLILSKFDNYEPLPVRRVYIRKGNSPIKFKQSEGRKLLAQKKVRPLGIPAIIDRVIQEMIRLVIEPIFEAQFFDHSYGFRPYRGCEHAIGWITRTINFSHVYVAVEGDIEGYFDNINHNKLLQIMWNMGLRDKRVLMMIKQMLKAGYLEGGKLNDTASGSPQGGIISPLLANIYLNNFDWHMARKYERHPRETLYKEKKNLLAYLRNKEVPPVWYVRYADDWMILTDTIENAEALKAEAKRYLESKLKLKLSEAKTLITDTRVKPAKFLGFKISSGRQRFGDGIVARAIPDVGKYSPKIKEIKRDIRMLRCRKSEFEKQIDIERINAKIVGVSNYISMGISKKIMSAFDNRIENTAYKTWVHMYGKNRAKRLKVPVGSFDNRTDRHTKKDGTKYDMKHFSVLSVSFKGKDPIKTRVGLTLMKITSVHYAEVYKQSMSPYTEEGRDLYEKKIRQSARLLARPNLVSGDDVWKIINSKQAHPRYNMEYFLNREYTYNRDKGKCKICGVYLAPNEAKVHHKSPKLPLDKVNKATNLVCLCKYCHNMIHSQKEITINNKKMADKIGRYRKLVEKE